MDMLKFLFLACFKICVCFDMSFFTYEVDFEDTIENYPFTVIIVENQPTKIINFGTLIHERAVLTYQTKDIDKQRYFNFQAYAGCSFRKNKRHHNAFHCSQNRTIEEYNIIDQYNKKHSYLNLVILVLTKPFEINKRVHLIELAYYPEDYDPINCRILYYMLLKNSTANQSIRFAHTVEIQYFDGFADVLVDISEIQAKYGHQKKELFGNPVVCRSIQGANWVQTFLTYVILDPTGMSNFDFFAHHISYYYQTFEKILYHSGFFNYLQFFENDDK